MGCQREIARQIVGKGGHYLLSLKENQQELYDDALFAVLKRANQKASPKSGNMTMVASRFVDAVSFHRKMLY